MAEKDKELRFEGKVAIVTGGVQGIGRACADVLVENGGKVVIFDIQDDIGKTLSSEGPGEIIYIHCDMTKEDEIQASIDETVRQLGTIDVLVNNVGLHPGFKSVDELSVQSFRDLLNLNLVSCFAASKFAMPHLRKSKGCIVNISSNLGVHACRNSSTYAASKGGVTSLTKALAVDEAKHGVRVNSIAPGAVATELLMKVTPKDVQKQFTECFQLGRFATPREIGLACLYLAVDATFCTGTELLCAGGSDIGYGVKGPDRLF